MFLSYSLLRNVKVIDFMQKFPLHSILFSFLSGNHATFWSYPILLIPTLLMLQWCVVLWCLFLWKDCVFFFGKAIFVLCYVLMSIAWRLDGLTLMVLWIWCSGGFAFKKKECGRRVSCSVKAPPPPPAWPGRAFPEQVGKTWEGPKPISIVGSTGSIGTQVLMLMESPPIM